MPPKGQYALTGSIVEIDAGPTATTRPIPICAVFSFDLFLILPQCSAPDYDDDVDINIDGAVAANVASVNQNINGSGSNTSTITQTATATSIW